MTSSARKTARHGRIRSYYELATHTSDQLTQLQRDRRTARPGLETPQQSPSGAVPAQHGFRTDDHQARAPIAQLRQQGQARAHSGIDAPGFHSPLLEERQLTTQHQVLGFDGSPWSDRERDQPDQVGQQPKDDAKQNDHAAMMPQPANSRVTTSGRAESSFCGAQR